MSGRGKFLLVFLFLFLNSCSKKNCGALPKWPESTIECELSIIAEGLSEDMSTMSSGEDEIIVLLYEFQDDLEAPLLMKESQFFKEDEKKFVFNCQCERFLLFLIEKDSERDMKTIETKVRAHSLELMKAADLKDYKLESQILNDDDLLGYQIIHQELRTFKIEGRKRMDRYVYEFTFNPITPNR